MNYTENYNLPQWEATDAVKRADVNGALAAVDAALGTLAGGEHVYVGSYTGDGQATRIITFPWPPKFMILFGWYNPNGTPNAGRVYFITPDDNRMVEGSCGKGGDVTLSGNTLSVRSATNLTNPSGKTITYILFR